MVETICNKLTLKIRAKMPEIDDERAEVINYGLQLLVGEFPKMFIIIILALILNVLDLTLLALLLTLPYRTTSGGVHLNSHLGCIIATAIFYIGNAFLSKYLILEKTVKLSITVVIWIFSIIMIKLYAPADTEAVPILREKERKIKKIASYVIASIDLAIAILIKNNIIANILIFGVLFQTVTITRFMYKITGNKYGYENYNRIDT